MSQPRPVRAGTTYMVTRRCLERRFFLRPSKLGDAIFLFVLAVAAWRYGIKVHLFCVMSNHFHLLLTDPKARLPAFMRFLCGFVARAMNALLGRNDRFWELGPYNALELATPEDVLREAVYLLANPVAEGLVRSGNVWPGLWSAPDLVGGSRLQATRPKVFFRGDGTLPKEAALRLTVPPGFASAAEFRRRLVPALAEREQELARGRLSFLGPRKVLAAKPTDRPKTKEEGRRLVPRFAAAAPEVRDALLARWKAFQQAYRDAWERWRGGSRRVVFPEGTYQLRVEHGVVCAGAG
jgi:REP element-mobilizing transposase RayT